MAQRSFQYALAALAYTRAQVPDQYADLVARTSLADSELVEWKAMAHGMFIPYDPQTLLFEQHEGFFELPHIDVDAIPVADFPLYHHWSYDRIYRNDMIKQPDVLMFMLLYNTSFTLAQKKANYEFYEPRCIHESSLSPSVHSILASELGRYDEAFDFFRFATRIDLDDYNRNVREGIHMTSIAAAWMTIVYGFGGMRSDGDELVFNPTIPERWNSYSFRLVYRGSVVRVTVGKDAAVLEVLEGDPVAALVNGERSQITAQGLRVPVNVPAVSSPLAPSIGNSPEPVL
jgi:maltose phosphorylase